MPKLPSKCLCKRRVELCIWRRVEQKGGTSFKEGALPVGSCAFHSRPVILAQVARELKEKKESGGMSKDEL